jgi:hypothetical protein
MCIHCLGTGSPFQTSYFRLPAVTVTIPCLFLFSFEMGSHKLFCPGWPRMTVFPISAPQVPRTTGISYQWLVIGWDVVSGTIWPGWPQIVILLISAIQVAWDEGLTFCPISGPSSLCLLCSLNYTGIALHPACLLRLGLTNIFVHAGLNHDTPAWSPPTE